MFILTSHLGQHLGNNSLLINVSRILWAYHIEEAYDEINGEKIKHRVDPLAFVNSFNSNPMPFKVIFSVRSQNAAEIIRREWDSTEKNLDVLLDGIEKAQYVRGQI